MITIHNRLFAYDELRTQKHILKLFNFTDTETTLRGSYCTGHGYLITLMVTSQCCYRGI